MIEPEDVRRFERHINLIIRASGDDPEAFAVGVRLAAQLQAGLKQSAGTLLDQGFSWAQIGDALGVRKSSAHERWRPVRP